MWFRIDEVLCLLDFNTPALYSKDLVFLSKSLHLH